MADNWEDIAGDTKKEKAESSLNPAAKPFVFNPDAVSWTPTSFQTPAAAVPSAAPPVGEEAGTEQKQQGMDGIYGSVRSSGDCSRARYAAARKCRGWSKRKYRRRRVYGPK